MQVIIRMDDITPDMDWEKFNKVRALFEKYNIRPLIGVVPECRDKSLHKGEANSDFFAIIKELVSNGWEVAQHGTYHVYETEDAGLLGINPFSEFAGLPYEKQYEKLKAGQEILRENGITTKFFMAPGHTYDSNTLKALVKLGFEAVTDGLADQVYLRDGIKCVPCRLANLQKIHGLDTVCIHSNLMSDDDISELENFIASNVSDIVTFSKVLNSCDVVPFDKGIDRQEKKELKLRTRRNKAASSKRIAWYLTYTNHSNSKIKWIRRIILLPMLLTNKYKDNDTSVSE